MNKVNPTVGEYESPSIICLSYETEGVLCNSNEGVEFEDWN